MDASKEDTEPESCNESEDGKKTSENHMVPAYMGALMRRQFLQEMVKNLPKSLQNRITSLKNIQLEHLKVEAEFFEEVYKLEMKYQEKYLPFFEKRKEIVTGKFDPPTEEPNWNTENTELDQTASSDFSQVLKEFKDIPEDTKGIPNFWLTIFRNTELLSEMVQEHDEPVLRKLTDITIKYEEQPGYTLEFHFDKNEYFSDPVLTKQYFLKSTVDEEYPFSFEGTEIYKCKGCNINWEKKMNLTVKTIRKKQRHKERGAFRTIVKQVPNDSFFNFFNPPEVPDDKEEVDEDTQSLLATDFEVGHVLRARIIPKAVLYYTGDIIDDEDDDDDEFNGEEDDDDEDDESGDDDGKNTGSKHKQSVKECQNQ